MRDVEPLNPLLHRLLQLHFGEVEVVAPRQEIVWASPTTHTIRSRRDGQVAERVKRRVLSSGEEYRVNCPFCTDTRKRLYINHLWGVYDEDSDSRNLFLCQCWNDTRCMDDYMMIEQLRDMVFSSASGRAREGHMQVAQGIKAPTEIAEVAPPGPTIRLDQLKERHPNHHAIVYLESRAFNPTYLGKRFGAQYCVDSKYGLARNRIICPIYSDGTLVGWQARYIGDDVNGLPFNKAGVPKYWCCPSMAKRLLAVNFELAVKHQTIVVVEGPTDVWRVGPQALGVMGISMNPMLARRLYAAIKDRVEDTAVAVMYDPSRDPLAERRGRPHPIDKTVALLQEGGVRNAFGVWLPEGTDPGGLEPYFIRQRIKAAADPLNIRVDFSKRGRVA